LLQVSGCGVCLMWYETKFLKKCFLISETYNKAFLAVDSKVEFQLRSIAQPGYSSERDFHLKKMRRVSYDNLVHHLAGEENLVPEEQREERFF